MSKSNSLVFFGNERLSSGFQPDGAPTLQALIDNGYDIKAVVANYQQGHSRKARELEIEAVARRHNIPILLPKKLSLARQQLASYHADAAVLVAYGRMVPQSIIDLFPHGILNLHPSLLPKYRGSTPVEQAMLDGAEQTGVSIMQLVREMDAGPTFIQQAIKLTGHETKQKLTQRLLTAGSNLLISVLPAVLGGTAKPKPQDESQATYTSLIKKSDGIIDLQRSATQLEREVRAYATWPRSRTAVFGHDIIILEARIAKNAGDGVLVLACNPGWLEVTQLIAPSGKQMTGAAFMRGYS